MKTGFSPERLRDPRVAAANDILRSCVHCGFCAPACPTYQLTGDERDSPRGRIWLIRDLMEGEGPPAAETVRHLDRCLECVACMPACPSGVDYGHLIALGREEIEARARRPLVQRLLRAALGRILTDAGRARRMLGLARLLSGLAPLLPRRLAAPLRLAARVRAADAVPAPAIHPASGPRRGRVALLAGCVQAAVAPGINQALIRLLTRHGVEVVVPADAACCGALDRHLGRGEAARRKARAVIGAIERERAAGGLDAVVQTASGCGTMMKDYAALFAGDAAMAARAEDAARLVRDASEYLTGLDLRFRADMPDLAVAWFAPCSAANAQGIRDEPPALLAAAGFAVKEPADGGRCCGSAGVYNMTEPDMAERLGVLKGQALAALDADVVAAGNIGCMVQMAGRNIPPVVHIVELLDWATGGPRPAVIDGGAGSKPRQNC